MSSNRPSPLALQALLLAVSLVVGCSSVRAGDAAAAKGGSSKVAPPNVIVILTDDEGYGDRSAFYSPTGLHSPHYDRFIAEGTRFSDFYVGSSVCSPSRAALMTGCYPQR